MWFIREKTLMWSAGDAVECDSPQDCKLRLRQSHSTPRRVDLPIMSVLHQPAICQVPLTAIAGRPACMYAGLHGTLAAGSHIPPTSGRASLWHTCACSHPDKPYDLLAIRAVVSSHCCWPSYFGPVPFCALAPACTPFATPHHDTVRLRGEWYHVEQIAPSGWSPLVHFGDLKLSSSWAREYRTHASLKKYMSEREQPLKEKQRLFWRLLLQNARDMIVASKDGLRIEGPI